MNETKNKRSSNEKQKKELQLDIKIIKRSLMAFALVMAILVVAVLCVEKVKTTSPYAFSIDGNTICYVEDKDTAEDVVKELLKGLIVEDTELRAVDTDGRMGIEKAKKRKVEKSEIKSVEDAVKAIHEVATEEDDDIEIKVASTKTEIKDYIPEPNYERDDTMMAGESKVKIKGKKGKQKVSTTFITIDGELESETVTATEIIDAGSPATVIKGTLGLPEGKDWRTFEGDPVFRSGDELVVTAESYRGKVPYKLGGVSLTKGVCCLGFVKAIYQKYGIDLPLSHSGMKKVGVGVSYANAKKGDIICYKSHVGIYVGDGKMVDATSGSGVSIRSVSKAKLVTVRRVSNK